MGLDLGLGSTGVKYSDEKNQMCTVLIVVNRFHFVRHAVLSEYQGNSECIPFYAVFDLSMTTS